MKREYKNVRILTSIYAHSDVKVKIWIKFHRAPMCALLFSFLKRCHM